MKPALPIVAVPLLLMAALLGLAVVIQPPEPATAAEFCRVDTARLDASPAGLDREQLDNAATIIHGGRARPA
jgi:hypothetical protein